LAGLGLNIYHGLGFYSRLIGRIGTDAEACF
jgi:hypothetical protein